MLCSVDAVPVVKLPVGVGTQIDATSAPLSRVSLLLHVSVSYVLGLPRPTNNKITHFRGRALFPIVASPWRVEYAYRLNRCTVTRGISDRVQMVCPVTTS